MANRKSVANRSELAAGPRLLPPETARAGRVVTVLPAGSLSTVARLPAAARTVPPAAAVS